MYATYCNTKEMNILELSKMVSEETGVPEYKTTRIISATIKIIRREVIRGQIVKLLSLLSIFVDVVPERNYFSVKHNRVEKTPRRFVLKIIPSKKLKKEVNAKKTY